MGIDKPRGLQFNYLHKLHFYYSKKVRFKSLIPFTRVLYIVEKKMPRVLTLIFLTSIYILPTQANEVILRAHLQSEGNAGGHLGNAVSISGNYALVGAPRDNENGFHAGAAYLYKFDENQWHLQCKLLANDGQAVDLFGYALDFQNNRAVIAAHLSDQYSGFGANQDAGAVYVYEFDENFNCDSPYVKLKSTSAFSAEDEFGHSVALSGDRIIVGAPKTNIGNKTPGAYYIFQYEDTHWNQIHLGTCPGVSDNEDLCGYVVDIDEKNPTTAIVGALSKAYKTTRGGSLMKAGAAYILDIREHFGQYRVTNIKNLRSTHPSENEFFGITVSISNSIAAVGTALNGHNHASGLTSRNGVVHVYHQNSVANSWELHTKLFSPIPQDYDSFGSQQLKINRNQLWITAPFLDLTTQEAPGNDFGRVFMYQLQKAYDNVYLEPYFSWNLKKSFTTNTSTDNATAIRFGSSIDVSNQHVLIGSPAFDELGAEDIGTVFYTSNSYE
ncbi:FG-GAP repeat protein [Marinicella sp. W31]|uniref:FG-GAP repeat protein n=1 Tax=Marinicella sp. W31 TaxID=3023713 RepID=UPI003758415C